MGLDAGPPGLLLPLAKDTLSLARPSPTDPGEDVNSPRASSDVCDELKCDDRELFGIISCGSNGVALLL